MDVSDRKTKKILWNKDKFFYLYIMKIQEKWFPKNRRYKFSIMRKIKKAAFETRTVFFLMKNFYLQKNQVF